MTIGDIYMHKLDKSIIQIDSFATPIIKDNNKDFVIVFRRIKKYNKYEIGSHPSFNGYGSQKEIEKEYEILVPQKELYKYSDWNDIFQLINS